VQKKNEWQENKKLFGLFFCHAVFLFDIVISMRHN